MNGHMEDRAFEKTHHCQGPFPECITRLTRIETLLITLIGNGQPGRIQKLEDKIKRHDHFIWLTTGGGVVIGYILERIVSKYL